MFVLIDFVSSRGPLALQDYDVTMPSCLPGKAAEFSLSSLQADFLNTEEPSVQMLSFIKGIIKVDYKLPVLVVVGFFGFFGRVFWVFFFPPF